MPLNIKVDICHEKDLQILNIIRCPKLFQVNNIPTISDTKIFSYNETN